MAKIESCQLVASNSKANLFGTYEGDVSSSYTITIANWKNVDVLTSYFSISIGK